MSKYIKIEDAIEQVKTEFYGGGYQEWLEISIDNLINRIANLPTIEVAFCEECKYAPYCEQRLVKGLFGNEIAEWQEIDFCQHGERIDDE